MLPNAHHEDPIALAIKSGKLYARLASLMTLASGILFIWEPLLRHTHHHFTRYVLPGSAQNFADFTSLLIGLFLVYLAYELSQHKHSAWFITLVTASASLGIEMGLDEPLVRSIFLIMLIIMLLVGYKQFIVRTHPTNLRQGFLALGGSIALALGYGTLGFWLLDKRDFGVNFSVLDALQHTLSEYLLLGTGDLHPHNRFSHWFLDSFSVVGVTTFVYMIYSILRPLRYELKTLPAERERAENLLRTYGGDIDDYFKLWPHDKSYFFSDDGEAFIAYGVAHGVALAFANPEGKPTSIPSVLHEFRSFCLGNGWLVAFIAASEKNQKLFEQTAFNKLLIGADAVIDINKFLNETAHNKYFRNLINRFAKSGLTAQRYLPPHNLVLIEELQYVSNDWLAIPGHKQWQFMTGYFSSQYFERTPLFVVRDETGHAVAFANEIPSFKPGEATVDLMRHKRDAPKNVMDFLFIELMRRLQQDGVQRFNLGLSPMARQSFAGSGEKLLDYIYLASQRFISTKGLQQYKAKFDPQWDPRYVYYIGGASSLPLIGLALSKLSMYKHPK